MLCWLYHREVWLPLVYQCLNQNHMFTCSASCFIAIPSNHHWRASCCKHAKDWGQALWFKSDSLQDRRSLQSLTRWKNTGITCCKLSASAVHDMNYRESSASTLLWNLCLDTLPEEVLGNFDDCFEELKIVWVSAPEGASGAYSIQIGEVNLPSRMLRWHHHLE